MSVRHGEHSTTSCGSSLAGKAWLETDEAQNLDHMTSYLAKRPIDAKAYGLAKDERTREKVARIVPHIVVIHIAVSPLG